jgi:phage-related protein
MEQNFVLMSAVAKDENYSIEFTLGAENPLALRFPYRQQFRNRCEWVYKGNECRYAGGLPSCDLTLDGDNGCRVHNNTYNFGGFFGLNKSVT